MHWQDCGQDRHITWVLSTNIAQDLEVILLQLSSSLRGWFKQVSVKGDSDPRHQDDLGTTTSAGIDESVKDFARHKLKIFGAT
jgi:hypothetical protein